MSECLIRERTCKEGARAGEGVFEECTKKKVAEDLLFGFGKFEDGGIGSDCDTRASRVIVYF